MAINKMLLNEPFIQVSSLKAHFSLSETEASAYKDKFCVSPRPDALLDEIKIYCFIATAFSFFLAVKVQPEIISFMKFPIQCGASG